MNKQLLRGRPIDHAKQAKQKEKLIAAARELLARHSYRSITIRDLGSLAGVNSAMIRYYFENKEGLFVALLDRMSAEHFARVSAVVNSANPIKAFIELMLGMLNENRGLARILNDEVLAQDSELKSAFIERFPKRMATFLPQLIEGHIKAGKLRADLNPKYTAFSLVSQIITPFIAAPVREEAWGIRDEELSSPQWADHIYTLFMSGCSEEKP